MRFVNKTAIITGGAQGIGRAVARRLLAEGANVLVADIAAANDASVVKDHGTNDSFRYLRTDVTVEADVAAMVDRTVEAFGRVDILISNVGVARKTPFVDLTLKEIEAGLRINLVSMILSGQAVIRQMLRQGGGGAIVNMSSVNGVMTMPGFTLYNVAKGGVEQLTRVMAMEHAPDGIRVNAVGPGTIVTEMTRNAVLTDRKNIEAILSRTPLGRFGEVDDVASVVAFLASDDAGYMTGETVFVDGGRRALNYTVPLKDIPKS